MRKIYVACLFVVLLIVTFSAIAHAAQFRRGKHIIVPKDEVIFPPDDASILKGLNDYGSPWPQCKVTGVVAPNCKLRSIPL